MKLKQNKFTKIGMLSLLAIPLFLGVSANAATPDWNVTGSYVVDFNYLGTDYPHDMTLLQDATGNITGNGGSPSGANVYTWEVVTGTVMGNVVGFSANYTATADAVTPLTTIYASGTIATDGSMSGTWSDNYQGGNRLGEWSSVSGTATILLGSLVAEDFGVVNYDTGLGTTTGYTAGFGLASSTFTGAQSVVVQLFNGSTLLQTNTAIMTKFNTDVTGTQFSSPFDVSGTFDYGTDGYWTNIKETEFGQSVPATKVVATVRLASGKVITTENTSLTGDPTTVYPDVVVPPVVITPTEKNQCKKDGWETFTDPTFKNQGQCVSYVEHLNKDDADDNDNDRNHVDSDDEGHDKHKHEHEDEDRLTNHVRSDKHGNQDRD